MKHAPAFLRADWRDLAILNYPVEPNILDRLVPPGTQLDAWNGQTLVSIVGFRFLRTQVLLDLERRREASRMPSPGT